MDRYLTIMSMMAIMDRLIMSEESNGAAEGTEYPSVRRQPHRQYEIELKRRVVEETFAPDASVSIVARRHDVNANLVFEWRKRYRQGTLVDKKTLARKAFPAPELVRIGVVDNDGVLRPLPVSNHPIPPSGEKGKMNASPESRPSGIIEIELSSGIKVRVDADIDEAALRRVMAVVREAA
jgi:transposase